MSSSSESHPWKLAVLILLSAFLGAGIWYWDKHMRPAEPGSDPIVVDLGDNAEPPSVDPIPPTTNQSVGPPPASILQAGISNAIERATPAPVAESPELEEAPPPEVESFDAYVTDEGIVLEWVSGAEDESLGYRIFRIATDGTETLVADTTTAASGDGELYKLVEAGSDGGRFVINRVNRDLGTTRLPLNATARMLAPPEKGLDVLMIQAEGGEAELDIGTEPRNLFIIGFRNKPVVEDLTDPDAPRVLVGETISLRGEQAVYFKADSYATIHVRDR